MDKSNQNSDNHHETWQNFGYNLREYIKIHKEELIKDSFDMILCFSRGGTILGYAFVCLIKDIIPEYCS